MQCTAIRAWARLYALFALALLVLPSLRMRLLLRGGPQARQLLHRWLHDGAPAVPCV